MGLISTSRQQNVATRMYVLPGTQFTFLCSAVVFLNIVFSLAQLLRLLIIHAFSTPDKTDNSKSLCEFDDYVGLRF